MRWKGGRNSSLWEKFGRVFRVRREGSRRNSGAQLMWHGKRGFPCRDPSLTTADGWEADVTQAKNDGEHRSTGCRSYRSTTEQKGTQRCLVKAAWLMDCLKNTSHESSFVVVSWCLCITCLQIGIWAPLILIHLCAFRAAQRRVKSEFLDGHNLTIKGYFSWIT